MIKNQDNVRGAVIKKYLPITLPFLSFYYLTADEDPQLHWETKGTE